MKKSGKFLKNIFVSTLAASLILTQVRPLALQADNSAVQKKDATKVDTVAGLFEELKEEIASEIPQGQKSLSYSNTYQSGEPEPMTYYFGSATTEIGSGIFTLNTTGRTIASWERSAFYSSGIMEVKFRVERSSAVIDLGVSLKSNDQNEGIAIRYEANNIWVLQDPNADGTYKTVTVEGSAIQSGGEYTMRVGHHGNRLVVSINDVLIYDGTDFELMTEQKDVLGQFGLYSRNGSAKFEVSSVSFTGNGLEENAKVRYEEDYETTTTEELNWVNIRSAEVVDDGTGNKVLEISAADRRVTDLNSPDITDGTLSLRYKVKTKGSGFAFGFRHNDNSSVFSEIGIDGAGIWVPESSKGWGSNLGLPVPEEGVWNDLMFNFEGKKVTIYLNKELIGVREFDDFTDDAGKFGLRLRNATLLIDDVIYTADIIAPEVIKSYENDFEDGITGDWNNKDVSIIADGNNGILRIPGTSSILSLKDTEALELNHGTMTSRIKPVSSDLTFQVGNATVKWEDGKWVAIVDGVSTDFVGDLANKSVVEKKWNNIALKFTDKELVMSINGSEAKAVVEEIIKPTVFGIQSSNALYLDDFVFTEKLLTLKTDAVQDKFVYAEYYETETDINYSNLLNSEVVAGRLTGTIGTGETAINEDIADTAHGVYQFRIQADKNEFGFKIGNALISVDNAGQWTVKTDTGNVQTLGKTDSYRENSELIVRAEILEDKLTLSVNGQVVGSASLEDYLGGAVGIYNPNAGDLNISLDAIAVEEIRVYTANYADSKWETIEGSATSTNNEDSVTLHLPGVAKSVDSLSPKLLDQNVSFDFTTNVDADANGGRYGFMLRTTDDKEFVSIEHDINGTWRASYKGNEYKFAKTYALAKDTTYTMESSINGSLVTFKITTPEGETIDFGSVDVKDNVAAGQFGVRSWYGTKDITISNLKMVEVSTLAPWYLEPETQVLEKDGLKVLVDSEFPRIASYEFNGKTITGQKNAYKTMILNGIAYEPTVSSEVSTNGEVQNYTLRFEEIDVVLEMGITVEAKQVVHVKVGKITDDSDFKVRTLSLGDNTVLYTDSSQEESSYANSTSSGAWHGVTEELVDNTKDMSKSGKIGTTLSMISENGLAASVENNVMSGGNKIMMNKELKPLIAKVSLSNGTWTYRHEQSDTTEELPWYKVVIGEDQNKDKVVDWQDAAILYRDTIYTKNYEDTDIANNMMYIAFNFASQANDPFLNSLENGKVLYNYTDGFGQMVLHKGYQAEGHDDDIPSYSNIGIRQGGLEDFNKLIQEGKKYNMNIGVHLNATEYHLDANELKYDNLTGSDTGKLSGGWDWIDDSYYVDQTKDVLTGELQARFKSLVDIAPGLDFFYIDVYTGNDYNAYKLLEYANKLGIKIGTEFSGPIEPGANFVHWGPDLGYPNKGNGSLLSRMVKNNQDIFVGHSLFKGQKIPGVTTWGDSKPDMQQGVEVFYNDVLPTKYMQHFGVMKLEENTITFDENVVSSRENVQNGMVELRKDGKLISTWKDSGTTTDEGVRHTAESLSLIPWVWDIDSNKTLTPETGAKLYHWNPNGGETEWELTDEFKDVKTFVLYELTQQGKVQIDEVDVKGGKVTLDVAKNTPYVLYAKGAKTLENAGDWGEGSPVKDFAFNSEKIDGSVAWNSTGKASLETVAGSTSYLAGRDNNSRWNKYVKLDGAANISQTIDVNTLEAGKDYTVSVWANVQSGQKAVLEFELNGEVYTNEVTGQDKNHQSSFKFVNTNYQRLSVKFNVPENLTSASIKISAANTIGTVELDDVKVWQHLSVNPDLNSDKYVVYEDFENVSEGWGPFEYISGSRQTHIASDQSNENDNNPVVDRDSGLKGPVMTWVLDGDNSLKINEDSAGRGVKTNEDRVKLLPNTEYQLQFAYTMNPGVQFDVEVKSRSTNNVIAKWALEHKTNNGKSGKTSEDYVSFNETFTTDNADDYQVIIKISDKPAAGNSSNRTLILDNFGILEIKYFDILVDLIEEYDALKANEYTSSSWYVFQETLSNIKSTVTKDSPIADIKSAIKDLKDAKEKLAPLVGLADLEKVIKEAVTLGDTDYSQVTWNRFNTALTDAKAASTSRDNNVISDATRNLEVAINSLVNVKALNSEIAKLQAIEKGDYTSDSYKALQASLTLSKAVVIIAETDAEVAAQITQLKSVKDALVKKGNLKKLIALVDSDKDIIEINYTEDSYKLYLDALEEAQAMIALNDASQKDIDTMITILQSKISGLVEIVNTYVDSKTDVSIEWTNGALPSDTKFSIKKLAKKDNAFNLVTEFFNETLENLFGYEISTTDSKVLPNGKLKVRIPLPKGTDVDSLVLFDVQDKGILEIDNYTIVDGVIEFLTDKLGTYVIGNVVEETSIPVEPTEPETPETGDNGNTGDTDNPDNTDKPSTDDKEDLPATGINSYMSLWISITLMGLAVFVFVKVKERKEQDEIL